ncbi:hypothetical protein [Streptomyces anulatus]|uniref:hypothetical protein n=1 Tax=Streptomyces anulatus TaxID=1892 RepID=UPI0034139954
MVSKNVAGLTVLPNASKTKKANSHSVWNVDEARRFLEHLREVREPRYAAYVLIPLLGLRRGEVLGLTRDGVDLDGEQPWISHQLNRVRGQLLRTAMRTTMLANLGPIVDVLFAGAPTCDGGLSRVTVADSSSLPLMAR